MYTEENIVLTGEKKESLNEDIFSVNSIFSLYTIVIKSFTSIISLH